MSTKDQFVPLNLAVLTVSDTRALETDTSGQFLVDAAMEAGHHLHERKAAGEIDRDGKFVVGALLPGRYEISIRLGTRILQSTSGPREVEIPIEPGATVDLTETIVVRPLAEE